MKIEIRSDNEALITGYVNAVERDSRVLYDNRGDYVEVVAAGTFEKALKANSDVRLYFDHVQDIGGQADGNLSLREDNIGLYAEATVTDPNIIKLARENKLQGWSFAFYVDNEKGCEWSIDQNGMSRRRLTDIDLVEVSILDIKPAYIATSIEMREGIEKPCCYRSEINDFEVIDMANPEPQEPEPTEPDQNEPEPTDQTVENRKNEEKDGQSETDMSIFYARKKLEIIKLQKRGY